MNQKRSGGSGTVSSATLLCAISVILTSCGPSAEEQAQTREAERLRLVAESEQALATFARQHGAMPVALLGSDLEKREFTAQFQRKLEGSVVAFRGSLLDVVRTATSGTYAAIFGDEFLGGTLVTLNVEEEEVTKLLAISLEDPPAFLVAARIDSVAPMVLTLEPCRDSDCVEVGLEVRRYDTAHRITGRAIAMQLER